MTDAIQSNNEPEDIDISQLKLMGQGRTAEVYLYGKDRVVKLFRSSFPKQAIENEFLVCREIESFLIIPKAHSHIVINGRDAIIFDCIDGVSGFKYLLSHPWRSGNFAMNFAVIHTDMHKISVPATVPELKSILIRNINMHDLLSVEIKSLIINYIEKLPEGSALCHGDYHPDNILIHNITPFILDWMTATRGNPLADVARTSVLLKYAQPGPGTPFIFKTLLSAIRKGFYRNYIKKYLELTGAKIEEIEQWELPVMAARLMEWIPPVEKKLLTNLINLKIRKLS